MTPLRDHGLLGDGHTAALVARDGTIDWWCAPRFDSPPVFDAILGGAKRLAIPLPSPPASFGYLADTNVLHMQGADGGYEAFVFMPYPRGEESAIVALVTTHHGASALRVDSRGDRESLRAPLATGLRDSTARAWREWVGPHAPPDVKRSLLALKLLTFEATGATIAAATASLPEVLGGVRNWDYRYVWIRDAAFCAKAFAAWGKQSEARALAEWLIQHVLCRPPVRVLYRVDGSPAPDESETDLPGYAGSRPVRFGNGAIHQSQLDAYGHLLETLDVCHALDAAPIREAWPSIGRLLDELIARWREPDNGIWEVPAGPRHNTYSKAMAWSAIDRAISIAAQHGASAPIERWERACEEIRADVMENGVDPRTGAFRQAYGIDAPDAANLRIPLIGFVGPRSDEATRTLAGVEAELASGALVRRYRTSDGLPGEEGAFVPCSFWLAELHHARGDTARAEGILRALVARAGGLGLFPEQIDPASGEFRGNYPQAFSHAAHLNAAHALLTSRPQTAREVGA